MGVRRIHAQLPDRIAVLRRQTKAAAALEPQPVLRLRIEDKAVGHRARHTDVIPRSEPESPEIGAELATAFVNEEEVVTVTVGEVKLVGSGWAQHAHGDVGVEEERRAPGRRAAAYRELLGAKMPTAKPIVSGLVGFAPLGPQGLMRRAVPVILRRVAVVEDGERPIEPAAREAMLVVERRGLVTKCRMRFYGQLARAAVVDHVVSRSRSMASKSARKFPSPNPGSPQRWISS